MKKLRVMIMSFLMLLGMAAFWSCQQGQEDVAPDGTTADVTVDAGDPMAGDDEDDDEDDDSDDDD